jgi:hypothetical protein
MKEKVDKEFDKLGKDFVDLDPEKRKMVVKTARELLKIQRKARDVIEKSKGENGNAIIEQR